VRWPELNARGHCDLGPALNRRNRTQTTLRRSSVAGWLGRGRLSGRPFCLTAGTGWCAVSPSRRFLTAIGMDHVLTSIAWGPSRRPTKFPLRSYKLALRTVAIFAPSLSSRKPRRGELQRQPCRSQDRRYSLGACFLFCVSDVTCTTPNSARCPGSVLLSRMPRDGALALSDVSLRPSRLPASRANRHGR
jgi:hypothetical protein